ncbi:MAG: rRNA adenine N-6-methyltransferase family protein [Acidimicrobiales bacterium]
MSAAARRWGWHQLDFSWAERFVAEAEVRPGELVLDVGAGHGVVTGALVAVGAHVVAVELHPERAAHLRRRFPRAVIVVEADAADLRLPRRPFRVVANPPYAITSPLLRRLLQPGSRLLAADLVLQRQAAQRWASPSAPGYRRWSQRFEAQLGLRIPRSAFQPRARVDHAVLRIRCFRRQ